MTAVTSPQSMRGLASAVIPHPTLWFTALRQMFRLAPMGWWKQWPPIPKPDARYMAFRMETAYGDPNAEPNAHDIVAYLKWCRRQPHLNR